MASRAYDNSDSQRMIHKRASLRQSDCQSPCRTPLRQKIPAANVCPNAPRKQRKLSHGADLGAFMSDNQEDTPGIPFWTNGRPLESFHFGDPDFRPEEFSMPQFPTSLRQMPKLSEPKASVNSHVMDQPSPAPKSFLNKLGLSQQDGADRLTGPRKRPRVQSQRQLVFDAPDGDPFSSSFKFPKLTDFNLPSFSTTDQSVPDMTQSFEVSEKPFA